MKPWTIALGLIIAAALSAVPWLGNDVVIQFGINVLLLATLAQSWNILGGFTGYVSFGNSVFYGLGTYGTAIAMAQFNLPFGVGLAIGAVVAMLCAVLVGIPILRLRGPYFAIATLGLNGAMAAIISNLPIAGTNIGLVLPLTRNDALFYELALGLLGVCTLTVAWIASSRYGMGLIASREDEDAAGSMGVNATLYKVTALVLSAFFTALAGGIHAYWSTFVDPAGAFDTTLNVRMVIMCVFGGPGTVFGPVIGAFILSAIYEVLASEISKAAVLLFGLVIVFSVVFMPKGLTDLASGMGRSGWRYFFRNIRENRL